MTEWVAETTIGEPQFWEEGGIYASRPQGLSRKLKEGEHEAVCPRCGARFVATGTNWTPQSAEDNRDMHFYGDEDIPSICAETVEQLEQRVREDHPLSPLAQSDLRRFQRVRR